MLFNNISYVFNHTMQAFLLINTCIVSKVDVFIYL